jgi:hypothetical protein
VQPGNWGQGVQTVADEELLPSAGMGVVAVVDQDNVAVAGVVVAVVAVQDGAGIDRDTDAAGAVEHIVDAAAAAAVDGAVAVEEVVVAGVVAAIEAAAVVVVVVGVVVAVAVGEDEGVTWPQNFCPWVFLPERVVVVVAVEEQVPERVEEEALGRELERGKV